MNELEELFNTGKKEEEKQGETVNEDQLEEPVEEEKEETVEEEQVIEQEEANVEEKKEEVFVDKKDKQEELEFNKNNRVYTEKLMDDAATKKDDYWDSNSPFVKALLLALLVIIVIGCLWIFGSYFSN